MKYKKSVIEVRIRLDPLEGWGHDPKDHVELLQSELNRMIPWYKPEVRLLGIKEERNNRLRGVI
jgi:hypothetical protein